MESSIKRFLDCYNNKFPEDWWEMKIEDKINLMAAALEELIKKQKLI